MNINRSVKTIKTALEELKLKCHLILENELTRFQTILKPDYLNYEHITLDIGIYSNGCFYISFIVKNNKEENKVKDLLCKYNNESPFITAKLKEDGFITFEHTEIMIEDKNILNIISFLLEEFSSEELRTYLLNFFN